MLKEEQAAELLHRCEAVARRTLTSLRGNLRRASTRAAAVWEMIVFEAASQVGRVEYEDPQGGPDVKLYLSQTRFVWIEVAYLHPRFDDEERRSHLVSRWVHEEAKRIGFTGSVRCDFFGDLQNPAGPIRILPRMDERKIFLRDPEVASFFAALRSPISDERKLTLKRWTVSLTASPQGSRFLSSGGLVQESPRVVEEHAAYRALLRKRRQHKVAGPRVVCIGSDTSRAVGSHFSPTAFRLEHALSAALSRSGAISGVLIVDIADSCQVMGDWQRLAKATLYPVVPPLAREPLTSEELDLLSKIDFNRWKYAFSLDRWSEEVPAHMVRTSDRLHISSQMTGAVKLSIPGSQLVNVLAGRESLIQAYSTPGDPPDRMLSSLLSGAWRVVDCRVIPGNVQKGLSELVELTLEPSHERVYEREAPSGEPPSTSP